MAIQSIKNVSLTQVPDLEGRVVARGEQVAAIGVEVNLVYIATVCVVVLDEALASDIPDLDCAVLAATGHTGTIRVELD